MRTVTLKSLLSLLTIFAVSTCLGQEVIVHADYSTPRAYDSGYGFGGYGLDGETESHSAADSMSIKYAESEDGGNDGACLTATLDATKSTIPEDTSYDYVGWGSGSALDLKEAFKDADLSQYIISFDAKIAGTETLSSSKCFLRFIVPDDTVAKDEDEYSDVVLSLTRGDEDGTNTFPLTKEYKTFSFNLKNDMVADAGAAEDLAKYEVKQISLILQAQGSASDVGKDADNVLYLDNIKLTKKAK